MPDTPPIWTCIPVDDFVVPTAPGADAARGGARRLWSTLQNVFRGSSETTSREEPQWDRPTAEVLDSVAPAPEWTQAASAVSALFQDLSSGTEPPDRSLLALVGPPGCGIDRVLQTLAERQQLCSLTAPSPATILASSDADQPDFNVIDDSPGEILVIPHLEHWYLRHEEGLALVRRLMERLLNSRRRVLIGCDSWAWAFLQHAVGVEQLLGAPRTLAPFDAPRLDAWMRTHLNFQTHEFRQDGQDEPLFPQITSARHDQEDQPPSSSTHIKSLAARARGNLGVALAMWRASLRSRRPDAAASTKSPNQALPIMWVAAPSQVGPPKYLAGVDSIERMILHAVLLHGGLAVATLAVVLPFSRAEILRHTSTLCRGGLLVEDHDRWRVARTAYPFVRQHLVSEGFLADAF